jgi:hypothetical protein
MGAISFAASVVTEVLWYNCRAGLFGNKFGLCMPIPPLAIGHALCALPIPIGGELNNSPTS